MTGMFLGETVDPANHTRSGKRIELDPASFTTHGVIVGQTGSGKTGLGMVLIEEALRAGIPTLLIDPKGDLANLATGMMSGMYMVGIQMSAPFIVFGLIVYGAAGVVARMMPQLQIFFLVTPLNILAGFVILGLTLSTMMMLFLDEFTSKAQLFIPH